MRVKVKGNVPLVICDEKIGFLINLLTKILVVANEKKCLTYFDLYIYLKQKNLCNLFRG